ncbi:P-loop containing nucleoside triphosphate hydrolase protein [Gonapodya prolifera JEL478]|uniref:Replication factor C subunit 3 n=1 Tax=Gonapodya prolifera (strain JEL478) TaxID=1344416 RepID=A0A138ZYM3_GONPJ|nr:P-loop containing nucleoside triphosphate hydrolase protein [Gonapodya prolifera JEL478]|eukprot:KXS09590.1 P-loop containing nucleoside triphosphate hydrolase protein [Gonapodya prolifera JEL478]
MASDQEDEMDLDREDAESAPDHGSGSDMEIAPSIAPRRDKGKSREDTVLLPGRAGAGTEENLPWVEKYRPQELDEVISHQNIISTISKFISENRLPHLLFYGPPGTGKTTTILAIARQLYGAKWKSMVLELNASDDRGIDVVREQIKSFASTRAVFSTGFKMIILDEADAMTQAAQAALRRVIESYTRNVRFCIICNYVSKIIPALQSRCTRFRFSPLKLDQIEKRLDFIRDKENINLTPDGKEALLKLSQGDMRRALNILQACHAGYPAIDQTAVYTCTGDPLPADIERILEWMLSEEFSTALEKIRSLKTDKGIALNDILTGVHAFLAQLELPPNCRVYLLDRISDVEYKLNSGCTERIQLPAMVGAFRIATEMAGRAGAR